MVEKTLLQCLKGNPTEKTPIWFLRQAGRYLPEYRELRTQYDFLTLCQNPKLASQVTLQPLQRFDLDAAIIFSDILIPAFIFGQKLSFQKDHGPVLSPPIRDEKTLSQFDFEKTTNDWNFVGEAISITKSKLRADQTMIGFAGAPFTLATYMVEGQGTKTFLETKRFAFQKPQIFKNFLMDLARMSVRYVDMQIQAGADVIMFFDTWAQQFAEPDYVELIQEATQHLITETSKKAPVIFYPGQGSDRLYNLAGTKASAIAVDWRNTLSRASSILKEQKLNLCLQGNLDPLTLLGEENFVREKTRLILEEAKSLDLKVHIFNVGHGLTPHTPIQSLNWVIEEIRSF